MIEKKKSAPKKAPKKVRTPIPATPDIPVQTAPPVAADPLDDLPDPSPGDVPASVLPAGAIDPNEDPALAFVRDNKAAEVLAAIMNDGWKIYFMARQSLVDLCREKGFDDEKTAQIVSTIGQAMHATAEQGQVDPAAVLKTAQEVILPYLERMAAA